MLHTTEDFAKRYEAMSDDELLQIVSDRANLVDQAAEALEAEIGRRGLSNGQRTPYAEGAASPTESSVPAPPRSPRWARGLIFAGYGIASLIFLLAVFASRLNPEQASRFSEAATGIARGLRPHVFCAFSARLKPCPDTKPAAPGGAASNHRRSGDCDSREYEQR